jgi:hypothetical protein
VMADANLSMLTQASIAGDQARAMLEVIFALGVAVEGTGAVHP